VLALLYYKFLAANYDVIHCAGYTIWKPTWNL